MKCGPDGVEFRAVSRAHRRKSPLVASNLAPPDRRANFTGHRPLTPPIHGNLPAENFIADRAGLDCEAGRNRPKSY